MTNVFCESAKAINKNVYIVANKPKSIYLPKHSNYNHHKIYLDDINWTNILFCFSIQKEFVNLLINKVETQQKNKHYILGRNVDYRYNVNFIDYKGNIYRCDLVFKYVEKGNYITFEIKLHDHFFHPGVPKTYTVKEDGWRIIDIIIW